MDRYYCPTCGVSGEAPCVTSGGRIPAMPHATRKDFPLALHYIHLPPTRVRQAWIDHYKRKSAQQIEEQVATMTPDELRNERERRDKTKNCTSPQLNSGTTSAAIVAPTRENHRVSVSVSIHTPEDGAPGPEQSIKIGLWFIDKVGGIERAEKVFAAAKAALKVYDQSQESTYEGRSLLICNECGRDLKDGELTMCAACAAEPELPPLD
jgi:hypothetical protein